LSNEWFYAILLLGIVGYWVFRGTNYQKDYFRANNGNCSLWGKKATFVECEYTTSDGKTHSTKLCTSGFWGIARHMNYTGDLM